MSLSHNQLSPSVFPSNFQRGFLPSEDPLLRLPERETCQINIELNLTVEQLPKLIQLKQLRIVIEALDTKYSSKRLINIDRFDHREVESAFLILKMLTQAYLWEQLDNPAKVIPRILSENIFNLLTYSPRVPVLAYDGYVLHNFRRVDENKGITLENIEPIYTFTGSPEEAWFIKIHVAVEAAFAGAIEAAYKIHKLTIQPDVVISKNEIISQHFINMAASIQKATQVLTRMYEHCSPEFFFNILRPYLEGTSKVGGIKFDLPLSQGVQAAVAYRGSSGAQSSAVPALDAILHVEHEDDSMARVLQAFIDYMPHHHREFILAMQNTNVPDSIERRQALTQFAIFREMHEKMTSKYIPDADVGTGGTTPLRLFLKKRKDRTVEEAIKEISGVTLAKI